MKYHDTVYTPDRKKLDIFNDPLKADNSLTILGLRSIGLIRDRELSIIVSTLGLFSFVLFHSISGLAC